MQALKILVVVMGVMLVIGFAALIAVLAGRVAHRRTETGLIHPPVRGVIDIPRGARIEAMTAAPDRLILALALPEGGRELVVIDLAKGVRLGTIELHAVP